MDHKIVEEKRENGESGESQPADKESEKPARFRLTVKELPLKQPPMEAVVNRET
jgi:hypothetical protein